MQNDDMFPKVIIALVILIFGGVIVAGILHAGSDVSGRTREIAQDEADRWIVFAGLDAKAQCADRDTDGDGYVSCTLVVSDPDGRKRIEAIECAGALTINKGCRAPKAVIRQTQ